MGDSRKIMQVRSARQVPVRVLLLDDEMFEDSVDKRAVGFILFDKVCEHLNLLEKDYFGLTYRDPAGIKFWLNHEKKIAKQLKGMNWDLTFEVKFYSPEPSQLTEDITRYQLCLQIRRDIVNEKLPCSFLTYTLLGSYTAQSELGDYDTEEFGSGYRYLKDIKFAPHQDKELLLKIAELHRQHKGQSPEEAELHFLENAVRLAMYGVELHAAKDAEGSDITLGVCASGLIVYKDNVQMNRFVWPKVLKISYRRNKYFIKIRPGEFEEFASLIGFKLMNVKMAKRLWKISVEHHSFFRFREPDQPKHTSLMPRFGSRFRYSGRTQFQTRQIAAIENRDNPAFDRVMSKRGTFAGRTHNMRKRDEDRQMRRDELRKQPLSPDSKPPLVVADRPREDRKPSPPEPSYPPPELKQAPPVAPKPTKPKPAHREPGSENASLNRSFDSFEDVPDRRSKMEKIHGVPTPLAAVLQKSMEKEHEADRYHDDDDEDRYRHQEVDLDDREEVPQASEPADSGSRPLTPEVIAQDEAPLPVTPHPPMSDKERKLFAKQEKERLKREKDEEKRRKKEEEKERKRLEKERKAVQAEEKKAAAKAAKSKVQASQVLGAGTPSVMFVSGETVGGARTWAESGMRLGTAMIVATRPRLTAHANASVALRISRRRLTRRTTGTAHRPRPSPSQLATPTKSSAGAVGARRRAPMCPAMLMKKRRKRCHFSHMTSHVITPCHMTSYMITPWPCGAEEGRTTPHYKDSKTFQQHCENHQISIKYFIFTFIRTCMWVSYAMNTCNWRCCYMYRIQF